ncbi:1-phosphatidylinositol phosphodiesterase [Pleurostoma richardsiae]|jgi:1-phosphatidylinositol phosphodiesterase|uniref:1-phosphatidylinositol phosphodiesterase n=1 Tax=Pleurostoma richardsiae TaxID=41990 RepID=A0AA38VE94_9PEZI|nr:1-phosphatidylinositol phosphodiesterase [Pleurostoma richardsiae]
MASLTIRNLTVTPLELKLIERFEGTPAPKPGGLARINSTITGLFNSTSTPTGGVVLRDDQPVLHQQDVSGIVAGPFETRPTDIRAADPGREVIRLTFETPGTDHRYAVEVPGPSPRSLVMKRLGGAPHELTAVYIPTGAHLAVYSSANLARWMESLHDDYPLSALSIPGTHNSPTCHVALPSVRCQAVGVREQLDNGVRFLDIRVSVSPDGDDLPLVHSAFPISLTGNRYFHDMLKDLYAFLDANPSEVLLMSVKREGTGRGTDQQLGKYLQRRYCAGDAARRWFTEPHIPTLGEARGKIVLIKRYIADASQSGWGIDAAEWPDNCADGTVGGGLIRVQDFYEVDQATNIEKKVELARAQLERAGQQLFVTPGVNGPSSGHLPFFVNFLSASNFFNASCWPEKIAAKVNPAVIEYLCMRHAEHGKGPAQLTVGDAGTGIVVTDWVGHNGDWDLIRCIVGWNARLQLKR